MAEAKDYDRIEVTKKCEISMLEGPPDERILEKTIHNPNKVDIWDVFRRLRSAEIIEIGESQEFTPVCEGPGFVVDYVPIRNREIRFVITE